MPVISPYSSSGSSYISPTYRSSYTGRSSLSFSSASPSSSYRRSSYRNDLSSSYSSAYSSYRSHRTADIETSSALTTNSTPTAANDKESGVETSNSSSTTVNNIKDTSTSSTSTTNRPSRYTSSYSYSSPLSRDYSSRISSRSSDDRRLSFRDRENNYLCAGGNSTSSYISNLRSTALSGAEVYQKYSISNYKPNNLDRFSSSSSAADSSSSSKSLLKAPSPSNGTTALDISKVTYRLRQPAAIGGSNGTSSSNTTPKFIATASVTTDDHDDENDSEYHVTTTIKLKGKPSIAKNYNSTSNSSGCTNGINNNNNNNDSGNDSENDLAKGRPYRNGTGSNPEFTTSSSIRINGNSNNNNYRNNNNGDARSNGDDPRNDSGGGSDDDDDEALATSANAAVDKESKTENDDDKVSYLRVGTSSKALHSTSPVGISGSSSSFRGRTSEYNSGLGSSSGTYRSTGLGTSPSSSSTVQKLNNSYEDTTDAVCRTTGDSRKEGLCGLWNIGNTCFMNSIIQCLSHTRELTSYLRNQPTTERGTTKDHKILAEYTKLIKDMWSGTTRSVNPSEMKYAFSSKHRMYSGSAQQDAQEFLRFFIDSLHGALNVSVKREPMPKEMEDDEIDARIKANMMWEWYSKVENSLIKDLFVGMLRSTLKCTVCNSESVTFDPFWDLSLPLPSTNSRCKLENCLDVFVKEEVMDGIDQPTCFRCKTRRKCTKSMTIERFPKYLVIHLKRFSETRWSKLTNVIEFPTGERELNLAPYASQDNSGPVYFSLYGISNHMGSTAGGHYIAACKHPVSKEWNEFNDNFVSDTSERSLVTSSAYVLFYERS
ncbi:ubiquitin carboxyl-terminal hydrolase Usp2 isoform X2 [Uranotaenia lowii]|uniref:ubiquitin carboxyl-terminal hydrolase Usp2 isoform X2 n=1 Tax=Uranotaenia lowii TaxID=190385 RepID=UPI002479EB46|nr:ubiquitin carboxyl-terminal hydrolase Usp2 isoform X2 [Uranotaenia lowii]